MDTHMNSIKRWMKNNMARFFDGCGGIDCTGMVEAWDSECSTGEATLDPNHAAWDVAVEVEAEYIKKHA